MKLSEIRKAIDADVVDSNYEDRDDGELTEAQVELALEGEVIDVEWKTIDHPVLAVNGSRLNPDWEVRIRVGYGRGELVHHWYVWEV